MSTKDFASSLEVHLNNRYVFTLLVLIQALFGSYGLVDTPIRIKKMYENQWFRLFLLFSIAYTATNQIEISAFGILFLLTALYIIRTPEERKTQKFI